MLKGCHENTKAESNTRKYNDGEVFAAVVHRPLYTFSDGRWNTDHGIKTP